MFSGIVETVGKINHINKNNAFWTFTIEAPTITDDCKVGDSIAVNGICLTVVKFNETSFSVDVIPETLSRTNLGQLNIGSLINLERAMLPTTRIGGHLIQGHIDTTCEFLGFETIGQGTIGYFSLPNQYAHFLIDKGYVAIDGMSLTIASLNENSFAIAFIPHTISMTNLQHYQTGQLINLEVDMVGKYIQRFIEMKEKNYA